MSSSNNYAEKKPTDLLKKVKTDVDERNADVSKLNDRTPQQLILLQEGLKFNESFSVVQYTPGLNFAEGLRASDSLTVDLDNSGAYQVTECETGDGTGVTQPGKVDFADAGEFGA